jgi:hypothetical protein
MLSHESTCGKAKFFIERERGYVKCSKQGPGGIGWPLNGLDTKRREQGGKNQGVQKLIPDMCISNPQPTRYLWIFSVSKEGKGGKVA